MKNRIRGFMAIALMLSLFAELRAQETNTDAEKQAVKNAIVTYVNAINS